MAVLSDVDGDGWREVALNEPEWIGGAEGWKDGTGRIAVNSLGPGGGAMDFASIRQSPPLEIQMDAEKLTVTWPPAVGNVTLEVSHDLIEWTTPQEFFDPEQRLYSVLHHVRQPAAYFRLRQSE